MADTDGCAVDVAEVGAALEEFFASELHETLLKFVSVNHPRFQPPMDGVDEHSHDNYTLFKEFAALVEEKLGALLEKRGLSSAALWECVQELHASGEQDLKMQLDFLLASTEYSRFLTVFGEYRSLAGVGAMEEGGGLGKLEDDTTSEWA